MNPASLRNLLVVEDNPADVDLLRYAFEASEYSPAIHIVTTVRGALNLLFKRDGFEHFPTPDMMFVDIGLPDGSGFDILEAIWDREIFKRMKVIVFTGSNNDQTKGGAQDFNAKCIIKPKNLNEFLLVPTLLHKFWPERATRH